MPTMSIIKLLENTLDDMENADFKKFQRHLTMSRLSALEDFKPIPKGRLENKTVEETVDLMADSYTDDGAATVTLEILEEMSHKKAAQKLKDKIAGINNEKAAREKGKEATSSYDKGPGSEKELQVLNQDPPPTVQPPHHGPQDSPAPSMTVPLMMRAGPQEPELGVKKELPVGAQGGGSSLVPKNEPPEDTRPTPVLERTSSCCQMGCCAATLLSQRKKRCFMGWGLSCAIVGFGFQMYGAVFPDPFIIILFILSSATSFLGIIAGIVSFKHSWSCKGRILLAAGIMFLVSTLSHLIGAFISCSTGLVMIIICCWISLPMPFTAGVLYICAYRRRGTVQ